MKANARMLWMQIHTYFAFFFLPLTLLYIVTGVLYMFEIKGGPSAEYEYPILLQDGWPKTQTEAKQLVLPILKNNQHGKLPSDFWLEDDYIGWYGYQQEVVIDPRQEVQNAKLKVVEHDIWLQLLTIHRGYAGYFFWIFGIMLGLSLLISLITGLVIAYTTPRFRHSSLLFTMLGVATLCMGFII
jgi:hypothetical protein